MPEPGRSPATMRMDPVVGHRGASSLAPENTLASISRAGAIGAGWVEIDVRLTRDGRLVILHDDDLARTAGAPGRACEMTYGEISLLDAGSWFSPEFAGERVPSLEDAMGLCLELGLGCNLEIKSTEGDSGEETLVAETLARALEEIPVPGRLLVSGFSPRSIAAFAALADTDTALNCEQETGAVETALELGCGSVHLDDDFVTPALVRRALDAGLGVSVFTVNDPARARELWDWGVWSVFTDYPQKLLNNR